MHFLSRAISTFKKNHIHENIHDISTYGKEGRGEFWPNATEKAQGGADGTGGAGKPASLQWGGAPKSKAGVGGWRHCSCGVQGPVKRGG